MRVNNTPVMFRLTTKQTVVLSLKQVFTKAFVSPFDMRMKICRCDLQKLVHQANFRWHFNFAFHNLSDISKWSCFENSCSNILHFAAFQKASSIRFAGAFKLYWVLYKAIFRKWYYCYSIYCVRDTRKMHVPFNYSKCILRLVKWSSTAGVIFFHLIQTGRTTIYYLDATNKFCSNAKTFRFARKRSLLAIVQ